MTLIRRSRLIRTPPSSPSYNPSIRSLASAEAISHCHSKKDPHRQVHHCPSLRDERRKRASTAVRVNPLRLPAITRIRGHDKCFSACFSLSNLMSVPFCALLYHFLQAFWLALKTLLMSEGLLHEHFFHQAFIPHDGVLKRSTENHGLGSTLTSGF